MQTQEIQIGAPHEGGYYAGRISVNGEQFAVIVAPKDGGEFVDVEWGDDDTDVKGALSLCDGHANTVAMAAADSDVAKKVLALQIGGFTDWYIPAQDELELCYRAFKPTTETNSLWNRSGINVSAIPPTYPYSTDAPAQTTNELFKAGGSETFDARAYWSSTQHTDDSGYAWLQHFLGGYQDGWIKCYTISGSCRSPDQTLTIQPFSYFLLLPRSRNDFAIRPN
jgi:hypothetical protein